MTVQVKEKIIEKIAEAEGIIKAYIAKTNEILNGDIDEELEEIVAKRNELIERLDLITAEIDQISAEFCSDVERKYIENSAS